MTEIEVTLGDLLGQVTTRNPDEVREAGPEIRYCGAPGSRRVVRLTLQPGKAWKTDPLPHLQRHSPDGFMWGYAGSGPAELARCLLIDALGDAGRCTVCLGSRRIVFTGEHDLAAIPAPPREPGETCYACDSGYNALVERTYQAFKFAVVAHWPMGEPWEIDRQEILQWLQDHVGSRVEG